MLYAKSYRWDQSQQPEQHMNVSQQEAECLADYFETHLQHPRVKPHSIDMSTFSKQEAKLGEEIFTQHSCIGCHQIMGDGKKTGGQQSASFFNSGKRLKADWIYRFNSAPPRLCTPQWRVCWGWQCTRAAICHEVYCDPRE